MKQKEDKVWISEHTPAAHAHLKLPPRIGIYDTTLRDGEQTAGLVFDKFDKLEIAMALDAVGVDRIEVGMPAVSPEDRDAIRLIMNNNFRAELWGFCRSRTNDVDMCLDLGLSHLLIEYPTSPYKVSAYGFDPAGINLLIRETVEYAKNHKAYVAFMFVDGTRTPTVDLMAAIAAAVSGGADEIVLPDTVAACSPETIRYLVGKIREEFPLPLGVHTHNEFGMATACAMAGMGAGAQWIHVTVNGLGEKSGNADIAEVVAAAKILYGVDASVAMDKLTWLARTVERISGLALPNMKPIVGRDVFRRESGAVIRQLVQLPAAVESYHPALVGQEREIVLGKKSGREAVEHTLRELGTTATPAEVAHLVERVKALGLERKGPVAAAEVKELLATYRKRA